MTLNKIYTTIVIVVKQLLFLKKGGFYLEEKGFEIKCLDCGCTEYEIVQEWENEYDIEHLFLLGTYLRCKNQECGNMIEI